MKDFIHLVYVPFTGLGLHGGYRGDDWFRYRIELFKNYTLKSLLNQTCRRFIIWLSFRPEEKDNPITREFADYLFTVDQPFILTFGGLCFWDDKYKNDNLLERLKISMSQVKEHLPIKAGWILETLQPSDDLYCRDQVELIQDKFRGKKEVFVNKRGRMLNTLTQKVADWNPTTNPPFYTIVYPADVFFDPVKHFNYMRGFKSHEDIPHLFHTISLGDGNYCVLSHSKNISTNWWHPFRGKIYSHKEAGVILEEFGIKLIKGSANSEISNLWAIFWYHIRRLLIKGQVYRYGKYIKNKIETYLGHKNR